MASPDQRAHRRPQEQTLIRNEGGITFEQAEAEAMNAAKAALEKFEELKEIIAYMNGTIVGKNKLGITRDFCIDVILGNPKIKSFFEITVLADDQRNIDNRDLGKISAYLKNLIEKRDSTK